jgi:hypothetical protein
MRSGAGSRRARSPDRTLRLVPHFDLKVVQESHGCERLVQVSASSPMVAQDAPVLEPGDGMLDTSPPLSMVTPPVVTHEPVLAKARCHELVHTPVAAIGEYPSMLARETRQVGASVMIRIVAVAWATCGGRHDEQVAVTYQQLRVTRPAVVLGSRRAAMIAGRYERPVDDPCPPPVVRGDMRRSPARQAPGRGSRRFDARMTSKSAQWPRARAA